MTDPAIDVSRPSSARVWNYQLDSKDNLAVDRELGEALRSANPGIAEVARAQRRFLIQAVTLFAGDAGSRQFLDIGAGLPAAEQGGHPYNLRTPDEIGGFFEGLELLEPGVVSTSRWRPEPDHFDVYCAVGRKP